MSDAYRLRPSAILDVLGEDRAVFLQGQLTQDVQLASPGRVVPVAGLTSKGKLLYAGRLAGGDDRMRLLLPSGVRERVIAHLSKYAVFQKVAIEDRSRDFARISLYGAGEPPYVPGAVVLPGEAEIESELLVPAAALDAACSALARAGFRILSDEEADVRRVEAGRPEFGRDADESNLPDEVGLGEAISTTKGCYVGQEIVARLRTYGRVQRRLVGFRFPEGPILPATVLRRPGEPEGSRIEYGRVTSSVISQRLGPIGLGFAFRDVAPGDRLTAAGDPERGALVETLPFP
jgi:folate-binding protein YgfZ